MSHQEIHSIYEDLVALKTTRIFIVGDIILDKYIEGKVLRISPEAPVPVVLETDTKSVAGGAANVAANVASMGASAFLCGRIGTDYEANVLKNILDKHGIDKSLLIASAHVPTTTKTRIVGESDSLSQHIVRVDRESTEQITQKEEELVVQKFKEFVSKSGNNCLIISDYGKGFLTTDLIRSLIHISNEYKTPIVTDPKSEDASRYSGSTAIKPNLNEARSVFKRLRPEYLSADFNDEIEAVASCYLQASGCENLVLSLSKHGIISKGNRIAGGTLRVKSHAQNVADVSGAGDTLVSFLAMSLGAGISLTRAIQLANIAAGICCEQPGTSVLCLSDFFQNNMNITSRNISKDKLIGLASLISIVADLKLHKNRIVFTNGCFDILHAGHVNYLQKARGLGDVLVLGLNSDSSITRLKGSSRPVQTSADRAIILGSLTCVDFIVIFDDETPIKLIDALKPDVLVKGADYTIESTIGAKEVLSLGGSVHHIELSPGKSTTAIIQKITYVKNERE